MAPEKDTDDEFRSFPDVMRLPLAEGQALHYSFWSRSPQVLSADSQRILQGCAAFATLESHAVRISRELGLMPLQLESLRQELAGLAAAGLLVSRGQMRDAVQRLGKSDDKPPRIATVGIPTRDRPANLAACLSGHAESSRRYGRSTEFVVIDDGTTQNENRLLLDALADRSGAPIWHSGPADKARFAAALARQAEAPPDLVRFALGIDADWPITTGGSRNALLLHTAGDLLLQADDDTLCQALPAPARRAELALSGAFDPTEFWFFPEGRPAIVPDAAGETDLLGLHEQLLGRTVAACLAESTAPDFTSASSRFFRRLEVGEGRILTTATGVTGDSGQGSSLALLMLEGDSRARALASETVYREAVRRRQWMRAATRPTITNGGYCMALNLGLDNRRLLPPFLPFQRNQDGVFGGVLALCCGGCTGYLPWMVLHRSPEEQAAPPAEIFWPRSVQYKTGHVMQTLLGSFPQGLGKPPPDSRLEALGKWLEEIASAEPADFTEYVRLHTWNALTRLASELEAKLQKYAGQPAFWAEDARRALAAVVKLLAGPATGLPADLCEKWGPEQGLLRFRSLARNYGSLLRAWPGLVTAAKELRARGIRLPTRCGTLS